jgi:hypothetical protein
MRWFRRPPVRATYRAVFGLALSAFPFVPALPANAAAGGHLYLPVGASIERFPLQDGIPSTQPDLTIPHAGGAIAFDGYVVDAFPPGQTVPARKIVFPHNGMCTLSSPPIQGLAVDGAGNLFVLVVYAQSVHACIAALPAQTSFRSVSALQCLLRRPPARQSRWRHLH